MKNTLKIYSDGSVRPDITLPNGLKPGGYAWRLLEGDTVTASGDGADETSGINRMELRAVRDALRATPEGVTVTVMTDSNNTIGWLTGQMKARDAGIAREVEDIRTVTRERRLTVLFTKVAAHTGVEHNEACDAGARAALVRAFGQHLTAGTPAMPVAPSTPNEPVTVGALDVHVSASGSAWRASVGGVTHTGQCDGDTIDAVFAGLIAALRACPAGASVRFSSPSLNHVNWVAGTFRAKVPRVQTWLAQVRQTAQDGHLTLLR